MALVLQNVFATSSYIPYERPSQPAALWTAIPRGLQSFLVPLTAVTAKPVNDDYLLAILGVLPPNFGYVMADANLTITQNRAADFDNECNLNLQNFYRADVNDSVALSSNWIQRFEAGALNLASRSLVLDQPWPRFPMIGSKGTSGIQINFSAWNGNNTVSTAGTMTAYLSFWVFDLEQIRKFPINSPQPVHAR